MWIYLQIKNHKWSKPLLYEIVIFFTIQLTFFKFIFVWFDWSILCVYSGKQNKLSLQLHSLTGWPALFISSGVRSMPLTAVLQTWASGFGSAEAVWEMQGDCEPDSLTARRVQYMAVYSRKILDGLSSDALAEMKLDFKACKAVYNARWTRLLRHFHVRTHSRTFSLTCTCPGVLMKVEMEKLTSFHPLSIFFLLS